jgi:hypothetical protein
VRAENRRLPLSAEVQAASDGWGGAKALQQLAIRGRAGGRRTVSCLGAHEGHQPTGRKQETAMMRYTVERYVKTNAQHSEPFQQQPESDFSCHDSTKISLVGVPKEPDLRSTQNNDSQSRSKLIVFDQKVRVRLRVRRLASLIWGINHRKHEYNEKYLILNPPGDDINNVPTTYLKYRT